MLRGSQVEIDLILTPGFGGDHLTQMIQLQVVLTTLYPADLVKAIVAAENTSSSSLMANYHGTAGNYSWSVTIIKNPM